MVAVIDKESVFTRIARIVLSFLIVIPLFSSIHVSGIITSGITKTKQNPPLSIGKPVFVTPSIYRLTDKHVVTKDINGLSFLDVLTGKPTQAVDFTDDSSSETNMQLPTEEMPNKRFTFSQNLNGDQFITSGDVFSLRLKDGLFCRFWHKNNNSVLFSVWDANSRNMLWEKEIAASDHDNPLSAEAIDELLLVYLSNFCHFFDLNTGQLRLTVKQAQAARCTRWKNFLLLGKFLIDTDKMIIIKEFDTQSLMLDARRVYVFSHPEKKESGWYSFVDLVTMEETFFKLDMPAANQYQSSYIQGVCNGFFMRWNAKERSAQIIDPISQEVLFDHPVGQTHTQRWGFIENDRQILFYDTAQMSCFDSMTRKLLWEKEFVTGTQDLGNGYFWEPVMDESAVRVFGLPDPKKSVYINTDNDHVKPLIFPSESCVLSLDVPNQDLKRLHKRYDWDGKVTELGELPDGNDNLQLPFIFKGMVYAWAEDGQAGALFKYINNGWSKVYQSNIYQGHSYFCQSDRFLAFYSDKTNIKVLNLGTNTSKTIETKEYSRFIFAGGFLVIVKPFDCAVYNPSTCKILDENAGQTAGYEKDTLYMIRGQTLKIFSNGKITQTKLDIAAVNRHGRYSVSKGMLLADNLVFDSKGRFCQELPVSMLKAKFITLDGRTCIRFDDGSKISIFEMAESAKFSVTVETEQIVIKNIGNLELKGECWIERSNDWNCSKLVNPVMLNAIPGESIRINVNNKQSIVVFKTNGYLDKSYFGQAKKAFNLQEWFGSISSSSGEVVNIVQLR